MLSHEYLFFRRGLAPLRAILGAIFHGLGSIGIAARAVLKAFGNNEARNFHSTRVRMTKPVRSGMTKEVSLILGRAFPVEVKSAEKKVAM